MTRVPRQLYRDVDAVISAYTGAQGEMALNLTTKRLHANDGATPGGFPVAHKAEIGTLVATAWPYSMAGNGNDMSAPMQKIFDDAAAQNKKVYFPKQPGPYCTTKTINLSHPVSHYGDAEDGSTIELERVNGPLFNLKASGGEVWDGVTFRGMRYQGNFQSADAFDKSCAFLVDGDGATYLQYLKWLELTAAGFSDGLMRVVMPTRFTSFGVNESYFNWCTFDKIKIANYTKKSLRGWNFTLGSGTGHKWSGLTGSVVNHYINFDGANCAVGDVLVNTSHLGGDGSAAIVRVGDNTTYRSRVQIVGSQVDGGAAKPFDLSSVGTVEYTDFTYTACNSGGGLVNSGNPPLRGSRFEDKGVSRYEGGNFYPATLGGQLPAGQQYFKVFFFKVAPYNTVFVKFYVSAFISGSAGGSGEEEYAIYYDGATYYVSPVGTPYLAPSAASRVYTLTNDAAITTSGILTWTAGINPPSAGSQLDVQCVARGGKFVAYQQ